MENLKFTLLQCRNPDDPMRQQEINCFLEVLKISRSQLTAINILSESPGDFIFDKTDLVLVGGAGDYSVLDDASFLPPFFDFFCQVCERGFPMFASCFGFQATCLALGGNVIADTENTEVGTYKLQLTQAGKADVVFGVLPEMFDAQMGHKDRASQLPSEAINLAFSERAPFQAFKIKDKPIYATQFHPELNVAQNRERFETYINAYAGKNIKQDVETIRNSFRETKETYSLLPTYISEVLGFSK